MTKRSISPDVPEWARGVVWYQILPERFRNGDPNNTPRPIDQKNAWPHDHISPLERHPWSSDWYRLQPYEKENGRDIWFNLQRRRYGGDLQGIIDRLDYLQDLGIGAIYLNPVFEAPSYHKYDAASYHHVDPNFGPDPAGDRAVMAGETPHDPSTWHWTSADQLLLQLIEEVHRCGMYIILDGVFNHMGLNSWIYQDILKRQQHSPFRDWMAVESWADDARSGRKKGGEVRKRGAGRYNPASPFRKGFKVRTWEGFNELPELRQDRSGIVRGPREYIFDITRRWMDPYGNGDTFAGVDGWRLDVACCIKHPFWKAWRKHVRSINPEACLVAEVIDTDEKTKAWVKGDEFDAVMNYNFKFACNEFFIRTRNRSTASGFARKLETLHSAFPHPVPQGMQNLLGSHDTDRLASRIVNRELGGQYRWWEYFNRSKAENGEYDTRKPDSHEEQIKRLMVLVQFTCPGAPIIYYGDEAGMWGANDPCCRKPMVWPDFEYEPEQVLPDGSLREQPCPVGFDRELYEFYRSLIRLRNEHPSLRYGDFQTVLTDDRRGVLVYRRSTEEDEVIVIVNNGDQPVSMDIPVTEKRRYRTLLEEKPADEKSVQAKRVENPAEEKRAGKPAEDESDFTSVGDGKKGVIRVNMAPLSGMIIA